MIQPPQGYIQAPPDSSGKKIGSLQLVITNPKDPTDTNIIQLQQLVLTDKEGIATKEFVSILEEIRDELKHLNTAIELLVENLE